MLKMLKLKGEGGYLIRAYEISLIDLVEICESQ